jgi:sugar phosphate isomerase/epimerase
MRIGSMNNPALPLASELERIASSGFDFADVTLEPPGAWPVDGVDLARMLRATGLPAVGHTAYYLPIASPFPELRSEARATFERALDVFAAADVAAVNVHPDPMTKLFPVEHVIEANAEAMAELAAAAEARGMRLMVENLGFLSRADDLRPIFETVPSAGFHLDVGHANLNRRAGEPNRTEELLAAFGDRLLHVHVSDNLGVDDLHLPLGSGSIEWLRIVAALRAAGWDDTVTLEIFGPERSHLETSRRLWIEWWNAVA